MILVIEYDPSKVIVDDRGLLMIDLSPRSAHTHAVTLLTAHTQTEAEEKSILRENRVIVDTGGKMSLLGARNE